MHYQTFRLWEIGVLISILIWKITKESRFLDNIQKNTDFDTWCGEIMLCLFSVHCSNFKKSTTISYFFEDCSDLNNVTIFSYKLVPIYCRAIYVFKWKPIITCNTLWYYPKNSFTNWNIRSVLKMWATNFIEFLNLTVVFIKH